MSQKEWTVGQRVAVIRRGNLRAIRVIDRLTKTQVVLNSGERYRIRDGEAVGGDLFYHERIEPVTEEHLKTVKRVGLLRKIKSVEFDELPLDTLESLVDALAELGLTDVAEKTKTRPYTQEDYLNVYRNRTATRKDLIDESLHRQLTLITDQSTADITEEMPAATVLFVRIKDALLAGIAMGEARGKKKSS